MPRLTTLVVDRGPRRTDRAASGMGRATAHLFADEGAHVAVIDRSARRRRRGGAGDRTRRQQLGDGRHRRARQQVIDEVAARFGASTSSTMPAWRWSRRRCASDYGQIAT
jgi:NAD(P)-dependent dehydrogenase (short-subunit alcohol dehydrogenase family)